MLSTALTAFAKSYNFVIKENYAFGIIENFLITVYNSGAKKTAFISCCFPTNEEREQNSELISTFEFQGEIAKLIDSNYPALKDYEITSDSILFTTSADLKTFDESLLQLLNLLHKNAIPGIDVCVECGNANNDKAKYVIKNNSVHLLCEDCANEYLKEIEAGVTKKTGKSIQGTLYALLGGFVGLLLAVLGFLLVIPSDGILSFNSLIINIPFAALITVLSFLFYRMFTGKKGLERIIPCLAVSALITVVTDYASTAIIYAKTLGIDTFVNAKKVFSIILAAPFKDPRFKYDYLSYTFYSLVAVIVVVLVYSIIFEEKDKNSLQVLDANVLCNNNEV
ncbi:MAG: hypothetical protein E7597_02635 [Ruminococcaceae bacterium]|nr:hypothetical protein [Oscillospiraceae bacterium]